MGEQAAADLISSSVFYISIGINDYIHYYLRNVSDVRNLYLPWTFNQFLTSLLRQQIKVILQSWFSSLFIPFPYLNCSLVFPICAELVQLKRETNGRHGAATYRLCSSLPVAVQKHRRRMHRRDQQHDCGVELRHEVHDRGAESEASLFEYNLLWCVWEFHGYTKQPWTLR